MPRQAVEKDLMTTTLDGCETVVNVCTDYYTGELDETTNSTSTSARLCLLGFPVSILFIFCLISFIAIITKRVVSS